MFIIPKDHWISPNVSGDKPPPVQEFTLSKIADEKVVLYGGNTAQGPSSELRVATVLGDSVVSMCVCVCVCYVELVSYRKRTNFCGHKILWVKFLRGLIFIGKSSPP